MSKTTLRSCRKKTFVARKLSSDHAFISNRSKLCSQGPPTATVHVGVGIKHGDRCGGEVPRGLDDGHVGRVSNDLGVVEADNRGRDDVCAGRKVDNGGRCGRADAAGTAAPVTVLDDVVDGGRVVGN